MKFFTILFLLTVLFQTAYANLGCERLLLTREEQTAVIHRELREMINSSPIFSRVFLNVRAAFLKSQILRDCAQSEGCTHAQIAQAVKDAVIKSSTHHSDAMGYGFLIGGIIANAAASAGVTVWVNPRVEFLSALVGYSLAQVTFIAVNLLSPFSEPISAKIRRFSFALKGAKQQGFVGKQSDGLERQADVTHATYTLPEQYAIERIFLFRNTLKLNFQIAAAAYESEEQMKVIAEIADAAIAGYHYFKDIDPSEKAIVNTIHATFLANVKDPSTLKAATMEWIRVRSQDLSQEAEIYYRRALDAWFV